MMQGSRTKAIILQESCKASRIDKRHMVEASTARHNEKQRNPKILIQRGREGWGRELELRIG